MTITETAKAYLQHYHSKSDDDFWAWEMVKELCDKPDTGVAICLALAELCQSSNELAYVAAGPFEDVLEKFGLLVMPAFREAAMKSERVRVALSGVWLSDDNPVFQEWKQLMLDVCSWDLTTLSPLDRGWKPSTTDGNKVVH
jgi:hypothetical protein